MAKMKMSSSKPINRGTGGMKGREKYNFNASCVRNANQYSDKTKFGARQGGKPSKY